MASQTTGAAIGVETTAATGTVVDANAQYEKDVLCLHPSHHPGMTLTSMPLDGTNYLVWSRGVYVSLGVKLKLGFIDGTFPRPEAGIASFAQWRRVDLMDLQAKYGSSNGPMIYQIRRDISSVSQGTLSVTAYFTKKKKGRTGRNFAANVGDKIEIDSANKGDINSLVSKLLKLVKTNNMPADLVTINFANYVHHDDEFADFVVNLISVSQLCNSNAISCFLFSITLSSAGPALSPFLYADQLEPRSFVEAMKHSQWLEAMDVDRYKERLVAKGYNQIEGVDYTESFSPVANAVTVQIFLSIASARHLSIQQLDINNAFLHGHLDEDLYMSLHDYCLFMKDTAHGMMFLLVYVDDIIVTGPSLPLIQEVKDYLHNLFTIKDIGHARYFLGLEIARGSASIYVAQTKYIMDIITDTGLQNAKGVSTPFPHGLKLVADNGALLSTPDSYRCLVGRLLYLSFTRPDVSHSVQQLSQYLQHLRESHWAAALHVVKYLKGCPSQGFLFPSTNSFKLQAFCDAD
ncbi:UNVERIFIED_CONTAM: Retrovirus-related Pol polyprotein from transposon RE2 [Sesamum angustifolium]|uniref:Retrovirus-related Pol polyprotein from transposon RE2 n=1 Tax=Sesamum angustifolium TaxID=2727405 RepID=A0AAW2RN18_9LAMI